MQAYIVLMQPTYFIYHGGGPCFFLEPKPMRAIWHALETYLRGFMGHLAKRPCAIVIVSGHWEATQPTVNASARPGLMFDYAGFPDYTYALTWPAPGEPRLAHARCSARLASIAQKTRSADGTTASLYR